MATAIQAKMKATSMGRVMTSPLNRPITRVILGEQYMRIPETVIGTPLTPAVKSIIGMAVTIPVAGSRSHCRP